MPDILFQARNILRELGENQAYFNATKALIDPHHRTEDEEVRKRVAEKLSFYLGMQASNELKLEAAERDLMNSGNRVADQVRQVVVFEPDPLPEAIGDALDPATRSAKRNLNLVWGTILFVWIAQGFHWPKELPVLGFRFQYGGALVGALLGLLIYSAWPYWSYSRADQTKYKRKRATLSATLDAAVKLVTSVESHPRTFLSESMQDELEDWVSRARKLIANTRGNAAYGTQRTIYDFWIPVMGSLAAAAVLLASLWGR